MVHDAVLVDDAPKRGLSLGPIIAIICVLLLVSIGIFMLIWDPPVKEISVINPYDIDSDGDGNFDSIRFTFIAVKDGVKGIDEVTNIRIDHSGSTVYNGNSKVKGELSIIDIRYEDFVVENGLYDIRANIGSAAAESSYTAAFVANKLNISFQEYTDINTGEYNVFLIAAPLFYNVTLAKGFDIQKYERSYILDTRITGPDGTTNEDSSSMDELPGSYSEMFEVAGGEMGEYSAEVTLENTMVKADSQYRTVRSESGPIYRFINRPPILTEVKVLTSKVRVNQEMELSCKAMDQDSNGGLRTFLISWGEVDKNGLEAIQEVNVTSNPASIKIKHIYEETGTYTITVSVVDNGPIGDPTSVPPIEDHIRLATESIDVVVKLF